MALDPQTSEHGGFIRGLAAEVDGSGDPVAAAFVRDALANNALHLLDSFGQYLVAEQAVAATDFQLTSPPTTEPAMVPGCEWDVPLRIRHGDNSSYRVVVDIVARIASAGTATFRIALRPPQAGALFAVAPLDPASFASTYVAEVDTTNTTSEALAVTLYLPAAIVAGASLGEIPSEDGGGDPTTAYLLTARLQIWATSSSGGVPQVFSVVAREFCGER